MRKLIAAMIGCWFVTLGCSGTARERLKHWFFEIPEQADGQAPTGAHAEPEPFVPSAMPSGFTARGRFASMHPPYVLRQCDACHGAVECMEVGDKMIESCRSCHPKFFTEAVTHTPVQERMCAECHDLHRSTRAALLKDDTLELCIECHDEPEDLSEPAHTVEGVERCTECHDPHFGSAPYLKPNLGIAVPEAPDHAVPSPSGDEDDDER